MNASLDAARTNAKHTRSVNDLYWRYALLGAVLAVMPILIAIQVMRIQVDPSQWKKIMEESVYWSNRWRTIVPARGQLYDRWGNLLAGNRMVYEVGVELQYVENPTTIAQTVATMLDVDYMDAFAKASLEPSS